MNANHSHRNGRFISSQDALAMRRRELRRASIDRCRRQDLGSLRVTAYGRYCGTIRQCEDRAYARTPKGRLAKALRTAGNILAGIFFLAFGTALGVIIANLARTMNTN